MNGEDLLNQNMKSINIHLVQRSLRNQRDIMVMNPTPINTEKSNSLTINLYGTSIYRASSVQIAGLGEFVDQYPKTFRYHRPFYTDAVVMVARRLLNAYTNNTLSQCKMIIQNVTIDKNLKETVEYETRFDNAFHSVVDGDNLYIYICAESAITGESCDKAITPTDPHDGAYYFQYTKNAGEWRFNYSVSQEWTTDGEAKKITIPSINVNGINMTNCVLAMEVPTGNTDLKIEHLNANGDIERTVVLDPAPVTELNNDDGLSHINMMNYILNIVY